ncbi:hypothetical protein [Millisia brevis]|uniref:hypothetical protein n=1 Tax=Millisia brevis TaxID=264148 RepID=UPI00083523F2|nr:hypothetical protein [Millisia brevis]
MSGIAQWWDGVELWVAGLPFVPQVALTLGVLVPLAGLAAAGLDRLVGLAIGAGRDDAAAPVHSGSTVEDHR